MRTKNTIFKKIAEFENKITEMLRSNPYKHGIPVQSDYNLTLERLRAYADGLLWSMEADEKKGYVEDTLIISGFPAIGKSYFYQGCRNIESFKVLDSDSSEFSWAEKGVRHPDFPSNYMKHIKENIGKADIIFVSSHDNVRQALKENGIDYILVYPDVSLKEDYIKRYKNRGNDESFINFIEKNWESFINEMDNETFPTKLKLTEDEFLIDVFDFERYFEK